MADLADMPAEGCWADPLSRSERSMVAGMLARAAKRLHHYRNFPLPSHVSGASCMEDARRMPVTDLAWVDARRAYSHPGGMIVVCPPGSDGCLMTSGLFRWPSCYFGILNWPLRRRSSSPRCSSWTTRNSSMRSRPDCGRCVPAARYEEN